MLAALASPRGDQSAWGWPAPTERYFRRVIRLEVSQREPPIVCTSL